MNLDLIDSKFEKVFSPSPGNGTSHLTCSTSQIIHDHNISSLALHIEDDITTTYNKLCLPLCGSSPIHIHDLISPVAPKSL